jgi:predicted nucleotide-binding protein
MKTGEIAELILFRLYELAEKESHSELFSINDIAAEFGVTDKTKVLNIAKLLENRGLIVAAHTFGGSHAMISGEGALLVESGGQTGVIQKFRGNPGDFLEKSTKEQTVPRSREESKSSRLIFIVHGHDEEMKQSVALYLEELALKPVILHKQPSQGLTLIEKLEKFADVEFAVILLSPDDVGRAKAETEDHPRARQNVIFEMGYFFALLGRAKVVALHRDVELPTDVSGIIYIGYDKSGAWKADLTRELRAAGLAINPGNALS